MRYTIENQKLKVEIDSKGAELISIVSKNNSKNYIWEGQEYIWKDHSPVLFPIVGRLKFDRYKIDDTDYYMNQHGFARRQEFKLISQEAESILFSLSNNDQTLEVYPYKFELQIRFSLHNLGVYIEYNVFNSSDSDLYFSIGAHPGFNCPFEDNEEYSDYYLEFEKDEELIAHRIVDGIRDGSSNLIFSKNNKLMLSETMFDYDALIFKNLNSNSIKLKSVNHHKHIKFSFNNFNYFGIWAKPNAPFICLEPWNGIADHFHTDFEFKNKEGIIKLDSNKKFCCDYSIEIYD